MLRQWLAIGLLLGGCCLLVAVAVRFQAHSPIYDRSIQFLERLVQANSGDSAPVGAVKIRIESIEQEADRAFVNARIFSRKEWIRTRLLLTWQENRHWEVIGVTELDSRMTSPSATAEQAPPEGKKEIAKELRAAFRGQPGVMIRRN